jgi:uncharacterized protein YegJ (DUF2314 family)
MRSKHTLMASIAWFVAQTLAPTVHAANVAAPPAASAPASSAAATRAAAVSAAMAALQERQKKAREEAAKRKEPVVEINDRDPAMRAAFKQAQATLNDFLKIVAAGEPNNQYMSLRVSITEGKRKEFLWISPFQTEGDGFKGVINNDPSKLKGVRVGQIWHFKRKDVVDWMYTDTSKRMMHGNFTTCVLLAKAPPDEVALLKRAYGLDCQNH